jgi:single-stranded DNA-specific DHH superfamily exonuclease
MITEKQLQEIREHLENARNPVFFFDNDADGLASFLILRRFAGKGRGVSLKGLPSLNKSYYKKAEEFNCDYIFVLDRPEVDKEVIELNKKGKNIPIVCIDHHPAEELPETENYYNTYATSKKSEPTSYLCYKATERKEDIWLAVLGCVADWYVPDFFKEFEKKYPELIDSKCKNAADIIYKTKLGKIARILELSLKDINRNVSSLLNYMINAKSPSEILEENEKTRIFLERYEFLNKIIQKNIEKAEESIDKKNKFLFFTYGGEMSLSQPIATELAYRHPDLKLVVGFIKGEGVKFSLRGEGIRTAMMNAIKNIEGSRGGGHEFSCGAQMSSDDIENFKENLLREIKKLKS